jgi:hypothetical protein
MQVATADTAEGPLMRAETHAMNVAVARLAERSRVRLAREAVNASRLAQRNRIRLAGTKQKLQRIEDTHHFSFAGFGPSCSMRDAK